MIENRAELKEAFNEARSLAGFSRLTEQEFREFEQTKGEDAVLLPTAAFASIGCAIADQFEAFPPHELVALFAHIEELMNDSRQFVQDAVATGLIEMLNSRVIEGRLKLSAIAPLIGPEIRRYWIAWNRFHGEATPELE